MSRRRHDLRSRGRPRRGLKIQPARRQRPLRVIRVGGRVILQKGKKIADLRYRGLNPGPVDSTLEKNVRASRAKIQAQLSSRRPLHLRFVAAHHVEAKDRRLFAPTGPVTRGRRKNERYGYFLVVHVTWLRDSEPVPPVNWEIVDCANVIPPRGVPQAVVDQVRRIRRGARMRVSIPKMIPLSVYKYKKYGLPKSIVRNLLNELDREGNGYYVVSGIAGVWRTRYSLVEAFERRTEPGHKRRRRVYVDPYEQATGRAS